jgi:hypothetical protein
MSTTPTKKFNAEIDAQLYDELVAVAQKNRRTEQHLLEEALRFYLLFRHGAWFAARGWIASSNQWSATVVC